MSELAIVSVVVSLAVIVSQVMAVESAELCRLQNSAAQVTAKNNAAADPDAWQIASAE